MRKIRGSLQDILLKITLFSRSGEYADISFWRFFWFFANLTRCFNASVTILRYSYTKANSTSRKVKRKAHGAFMFSNSWRRFDSARRIAINQYRTRANVLNRIVLNRRAFVVTASRLKHQPRLTHPSGFLFFFFTVIFLRSLRSVREPCKDRPQNSRYILVVQDLAGTITMSAIKSRCSNTRWTGKDVLLLPTIWCIVVIR